MPWADHIAKEPQWSSRLVRRRQLDYFSMVNGRAYFLRYLKGMALHMPFDTPPKLEDAHIAIALFAATQGENRKLKHLLVETIKIAMVCGAKTLDVSHFVEVFDKLYAEESSPSRSRVNPFTQKADEVKISEVVELSRYIPNASAPIGRMFSLPQTLIEINENPNWNEKPMPYEVLLHLL
jgi:hypothetical protein